MKYFTVATLTLLAATAQANTTPTPNPVSSVLASIVGYSEHVISDVCQLISPSKNLITARLEKPKPLSADSFVTINPTDNCCVAGSKEEYYTALYKESDPDTIKKMIFCPNAPAFLKDLDTAKLTGKASGTQLQHILTALMLRRETLVDKYSDSFVDTKFMSCYNELWSKVHGTDPAKMEYWPCDNKSCAAATIKNSFTTFTNENESCKVILKDQLTVYADKVVAAAVKHKLTAAPALRKAIRVNLDSTPHLSIPFSAFYDTLTETTKQAAAAKIQEALADVKSILFKQTKGTSTVYSDAENCFKATFDNSLVNNKSIIAKLAPTKTVDTPTKTDPSIVSENH